MRKTLLMTVAAATLLILPAAAFAGSSPERSPSQKQAAMGANEAARRSTDTMSGRDDRTTAALNLLEANGYTQFSNFQPAGSDFQAMVTRKGRQMTVVVDPDSGTISPQTTTASNPPTSNGYSGGSTSPAMQSGGARDHGGSSMKQRSGSSSMAPEVYHDFYNPEGGSPPTGGTEGAAAKKH